MPTQSQLPIAQHQASDLVFVSEDKELVTDSFLVAKFFGKRHDNVTQKIKSLELPNDFANLHFKVCYKNNELQNGKPQLYYQMTKDGFMLLVMGFTGKKSSGHQNRLHKRFQPNERTTQNRSPLLLSLKTRSTCPSRYS